jgi:methionyl-tRNA formyltransferase
LHMLREGKPELVGVTVHHIDPGIDSGDIILTARPELMSSDTFERIEVKAFLLGIELLLKAVHLLHEGRAPRVRQWTEGKLFLQRTGYLYRPWQRYEVRHAIQHGLISDYLANRSRRDADIRIIEEDLRF